MACHHPIPAYLSAEGKVTFERKEKALGRTGLLHLRCGMCRGCKADLAREWAIRCYHESQMHPVSCFATLTYRDEKLPPGGSLDTRDLELFWKKLRHRVKTKIRYFACGEYGEKRSRPHYHACIFGWRPSRNETEIVGKSKKGNLQFSSDTLSSAWPYGWAVWTEFDPSCARYAAHYTADKLKKYALDEIDPETGLKPYERMEIDGTVYQLVPEFQRQSNRPGLGIKWLEENFAHVFHRDSVIMDGREYPPPRAYWKWLKENQPELAEKVAAKRRAEIAERPYETGLRQMQKEKAFGLQLDRLVRPTHSEGFFK